MNSFSPKEIAQALGVSQASIKRWVDKGLIEAEKTAGGHRRITVAALQQYLSSQGKELKHPEILKITLPGKYSEEQLQQTAPLILELLQQLKQAEALQLISEMLKAGVHSYRIFDSMLKPAITSIRNAAKNGEIDDFLEGRMLHICQRLLFAFESHFQAPADDVAHAMLGTLSGDRYTLDIQMLEVCLREVGLRTEFLGSELSGASYIRALEMLKPQILVLGLSSLAGDTLDELRKIDKYCREQQILLLIKSELPIDFQSEFTSIIKVEKFSNIEGLL